MAALWKLVKVDLVLRAWTPARRARMILCVRSQPYVGANPLTKNKKTSLFRASHTRTICRAIYQFFSLRVRLCVCVCVDSRWPLKSIPRSAANKRGMRAVCKHSNGGTSPIVRQNQARNVFPIMWWRASGSLSRSDCITMCFVSSLDSLYTLFTPIYAGERLAQETLESLPSGALCIYTHTFTRSRSSSGM